MLPLVVHQNSALLFLRRVGDSAAAKTAAAAEPTDLAAAE